MIAGLAQLQEQGVIKRIGVVVRHHELGYRANAMVVWDIPDDRVSALGHCIGKFDFVTLCYQRPRRLPAWRYNLFCMIHGRDREEVLSLVAQLKEQCGLQMFPTKCCSASAVSSSAAPAMWQMRTPELARLAQRRQCGADIPMDELGPGDHQRTAGRISDLRSSLCRGRGAASVLPNRN